MQIRIEENSFFVFDLDDTLYREIDFLKSAYCSISAKLYPFISENIYEEMWRRYQNKENVFNWILTEYREQLPDITTEWLLKEYREHLPAIELNASTDKFLNELFKRKVKMGLITDGRGLTQRNKLKALGIEKYFSDIIISEEFGSEKPDERNYLYFQNKYPGMKFYFFGDNTTKDFIVPKKLGWKTVCMKSSGHHIHQQTFGEQGVSDYIILGFDEVEIS